MLTQEHKKIESKPTTNTNTIKTQQKIQQQHKEQKTKKIPNKPLN